MRVGGQPTRPTIDGPSALDGSAARGNEAPSGLKVIVEGTATAAYGYEVYWQSERPDDAGRPSFSEWRRLSVIRRRPSLSRSGESNARRTAEVMRFLADGSAVSN